MTFDKTMGIKMKTKQANEQSRDKERLKNIIARIEQNIKNNISINSSDIQSITELAAKYPNNNSIQELIKKANNLIEKSQQEEIQKHQKSLSTPYLAKEVLSSREYFENNEEVKKSENTLRIIESGTSLASKEILQVWESLSSSEDRKKRTEFLEQLESKKSDIFKTLILENRTELRPEETIRLEEIDKERLRLLKRETHDAALKDSFGEYNKSTANDIVTNKKQEFEQCIKQVGSEFKKTDHILAQETKLLEDYVINNHTKSKHSSIESKHKNVSGIDLQIKKAKKELQEMQTNIITKTEAKVVNKEEKVMKTSFRDAQDKQRIGIESEASKKLASFKAKIALESAPTINISKNNLKPNITPRRNLTTNNKGRS